MRKLVSAFSLILVLMSMLSITGDLQLTHASPYTDVDVETAYYMITNGSFPDLIAFDVRTKSEYDSGHIYDAVWIPVDELEMRIKELAGHEDHEIVVYCRSGGRSATASGILDSYNFTKVYNMLGGILEWESVGYPTWIATVHNLNSTYNYDTIQAAINTNQTLDGHTIFVEKGVYYEHIVVDKSLSLIGENKSNTIVEGNNTVIVILITADHVTIRGFTVTHGSTGIYVDHSKASLVAENNVTNNVDGIMVRFSDNCTIYRNSVGNNTNRGTLVTNSWNFTVRDNDVYGNGWYGINANASSNGLIVKNHVYRNNLDGIGLLDSDNCIIAGNLITSNIVFGIWIDSSNYNSIYHNNIVNNEYQATSNSPLNAWNNSEEGNCWSDYNGNDSNHDGIGDSWHEIDENNIDHYPLVGMFHSFNTSLGYNANVISNSTIEGFQYSESNSTIKMYVSGEEEFGFCRVSIPHMLMNASSISVIIDDGLTPVLHSNYTLYDNGTHRWIYFAYQHSTHEIAIVREFPSTIILPLFMIITLLAVIVYKKNGMKGN